MLISSLNIIIIIVTLIRKNGDQPMFICDILDMKI